MEIAVAWRECTSGCLVLVIFVAITTVLVRHIAVRHDARRVLSSYASCRPSCRPSRLVGRCVRRRVLLAIASAVGSCRPSCLVGRRVGRRVLSAVVSSFAPCRSSCCLSRLPACPHPSRLTCTRPLRLVVQPPSVVSCCPAVFRRVLSFGRLPSRLSAIRCPGKAVRKTSKGRERSGKKELV